MPQKFLAQTKVCKNLAPHVLNPRQLVYLVAGNPLTEIVNSTLYGHQPGKPLSVGPLLC